MIPFATGYPFAVLGEYLFPKVLPISFQLQRWLLLKQVPLAEVLLVGFFYIPAK